MGLVSKVKDEMEELLEHYPHRYLDDDDGIVLDEEKLIQHAYEKVTDSDDEVPDDVYRKVSGRFLRRLQEGLEEAYRERKEYQKDPYRYNGLNRRDFY